MNPLSALSLAEIRTALERGALSAREIVRHTLDHIDRQNPALNAFTHITRERMQKEADRLDRSRALGQTLPALAGIPYAVKTCSTSPVKPRWPAPACSASGHRPAATPGASPGWRIKARCFAAC